MPDESRPAFVPTWPVCKTDGCFGAVVHADACMAHLGGQLDAYLGTLSPGADIDGRGTVVSAEIIERLLSAVRDQRGVHIGAASFDHAEIDGQLLFDQAYFSAPVRFDHARFSAQLVFVRTEFGADARFDDASFAGPVNFEDVQVAGSLTFDNARFSKRAWLGPLRAADLNVSRVRCSAMTEIDVRFDKRVDSLRCQLARFEEGVRIRADGGSMYIEQARFGGPSLIAGTGALPRLQSLRAVDVSNLELDDVDLRWCAFAGAHRLDQVRLAGRYLFARAPRGLRWTRRWTIAEEGAWREWSTDRPPRWEIQPIEPARIAGLYRSLRKAFEDSKNEAGAGDFYYGEMEMRRHSTETPRAERAILWVYWLLSGYGQRAARAIAALLVVIVTVWVLLALWGQPEAAQIAVGAVVLREPGAELTEAGQWTVMVARVLGPVLLALAVLAVRARVKR